MTTRKPCPGCNKVKGGRRAGCVCSECAVAIVRIGEARAEVADLREQLARLRDGSVPVDLGEYPAIGHLHGVPSHRRGAVARPHDAIVEVWRRLCAAVSTPGLTDSDGHSKHRHDALRATRTMGSGGVRMAMPESLHVLVALAACWQETLAAAYRAGRADGNDLVVLLARGLRTAEQVGEERDQDRRLEDCAAELDRILEGLRDDGF